MTFTAKIIKTTAENNDKGRLTDLMDDYIEDEVKSVITAQAKLGRTTAMFNVEEMFNDYKKYTLYHCSDRDFYEFVSEFDHVVDVFLDEDGKFESFHVYGPYYAVSWTNAMGDSMDF